jgi:dihydroorotase
MRDRALVAEAGGWGKSVNRIQQIPAPKPRNVEHTMAAIVRAPRSL